MDCRRHLAARPRHPSVGDQCHVKSLVLQHAKRRRELAQLGHPVRTRALEADHDDDVAVDRDCQSGERAERPRWASMPGNGARPPPDRPSVVVAFVGSEVDLLHRAGPPSAERPDGWKPDRPLWSIKQRKRTFVQRLKKGHGRLIVVGAMGPPLGGLTAGADHAHAARRSAGHQQRYDRSALAALAASSPVYRSPRRTVRTGRPGAVRLTRHAPT
jgi:hypothetical protein